MRVHGVATSKHRCRFAGIFGELYIQNRASGWCALTCFVLRGRWAQDAFVCLGFCECGATREQKQGSKGSDHVTKAKSTKVKKADKGKKKCPSCQLPRSLSAFYTSHSSLHGDGKIPYCKTCLLSVPTSDIKAVRDLLRQIDKPWVASIWRSISTDGKGKELGRYLRIINSLPQYTGWGGSQIVEDIADVAVQEAIKAPTGKKKSKAKKTGEYNLDHLRKFWGNMWLEEDLIAFQDFYDSFTKNYNLVTSQHIEFAKMATMNNVRARKALSEGDVANAQKYTDMFDKMTKAGNIQPQQLSKADIQGGLNTFGELVKQTEQAKDIIPILPVFRKKPQDSVDFTIWCYVNYIQRLLNIPESPYEELYQYIDQRTKDYEASTKSAGKEAADAETVPEG